MRKHLLTVLLLFCAITQVGAIVNQIRWGTSNDPFHGLTITWSNTGSTDSISWGYTTALEQGTFNGTRRSGYSTPGFFAYQFLSLFLALIAGFLCWLQPAAGACGADWRGTRLL
ncbi:MAG: hypothetical protein EBZ77_12435 [Chitinophagia bacterium]|nr:hypothetical protein [Chitinophagia bacterium]